MKKVVTLQTLSGVTAMAIYRNYPLTSEVSSSVAGVSVSTFSSGVGSAAAAIPPTLSLLLLVRLLTPPTFSDEKNQIMNEIGSQDAGNYSDKSFTRLNPLSLDRIYPISIRMSTIILCNVM